MLTTTETGFHRLLTLAIYGLVIFPRISAYVDIAVIDLVRQVVQGCDPTPAILAETIRSLSDLRTRGSGQFTGCLPLFCTWLKGHLPCAVPNFTPVYQLPYTTLLDILLSKWILPKGMEDWKKKLQDLKEEDIVWIAPWMPRYSMTYSCGEYNWVPLLGPWGATTYAPLQSGRQLGDSQVVPVLYGMEDCDFTYGRTMLEEKGMKLHQAWSTPRKIQPNNSKSGIFPAYIPWRAQHEPQ